MEENNILLIDDEFSPILIGSECEEFSPILQDFIRTGAKNSAESTENWLPQKLSEYLPEKSKEEIDTISHDIISSLEKTEEKKASLTRATESGRSRESWFASEMVTATSSMSPQETVQYLDAMQTAVDNSNSALYRTVTTQSGAISQNPHLDGFIAEQYHAQTFNMNATASGSEYRAEVLEPKPGETYAKNSVDVVIKDEVGKIVRRYQLQYCKDAAATQRAINNGKYTAQSYVVADGQVNDVVSKCSNVIESPDGITSNPLSKESAEYMRDKAQSGNMEKLDWNEYNTKTVAKNIAGQVGTAAVQGALINTGFYVADKVIKGEHIESEEVVETALKGGADFGVKTAAAGALKVAVEKDIITVIPKGVPGATYANIAFVAIEDVKVVGKMATGELTALEGIDKLEETTVSSVAGLAASAKGIEIGAAVGAALGGPLAPVTTAIGSFIGGTVAFMAGSKFGQAVTKVRQKLRDCAISVIEKAGSTIRSGAQSIASGIRNAFSGLVSLFC